MGVPVTAEHINIEARVMYSNGVKESFRFVLTSSLDERTKEVLKILNDNGGKAVILPMGNIPEGGGLPPFVCLVLENICRIEYVYPQEPQEGDKMRGELTGLPFTYREGEWFRDD